MLTRVLGTFVGAGGIMGWYRRDAGVGGRYDRNGSVRTTIVAFPLGDYTKERATMFGSLLSLRLR